MSGKTFRLVRQSKGLTQEDLGIILDLSRRQIGKYENDQAVIPNTVAFAMAWISKYDTIYPWSKFGLIK